MEPVDKPTRASTNENSPIWKSPKAMAMGTTLP